MKYQFFNPPDWNQISPTQRTDLAEELSENLPNFEFTDIQLCEFVKQKNTLVSAYLEPTNINDNP